MIVQGGDSTELAAHQLMERALWQQCVTEVGDTCRRQSDTHVIQVVKVASQMLFCKVARHMGEVVHYPLPVYVPGLREFQQGSDVRIDFKKRYVREGQRTVRHHAFELHTQVFRVVADLHQVTAPVDGRLRRVKHLLRHYPYLWHDFLRHHTVDAPVVVILRPAVP